MSINLESECELALKAVSSIGEEILSPSRRVVSSIKGSPRDIVTEADQNSHEFLVRILKDSRYPIYSEEQANAEGGLAQKLQTEEAFWIIDPIDGTVNFLNQVPYYAVSVGLYQSGRFLVGALSAPAFKELYFTRGEESFLNGKRLKISDQKLSESLVAACFSGSVKNIEEKKKQYTLFGEINDASRGCLRLGSAAMAVAYVAAGRLHAVYGVETQIWDIAGALSIAQKAGCKLVVSSVPNSTRMNFIVGTSSAVDQIYEQMRTYRFF